MVAGQGISGLLAGRYAVERLLGEGATATVHLARDTHAGVSVAIKVLRPELAGAGSSAADRFLREIRRTASLDHPRILKVLDTGEHEGRPFFVLPYMEGGTLRQRLKREPQLPIAEAITIARSIAEALDYAHARGLVHKDVKPENIVFTGGVACLGDFGIARALETVYGGEASTSAFVIRGTPAYMSPEQAAGEQELDGRSDQYSLACVVYEMITGMPAFMGPTPESVIAQRFAHGPRGLRVYRSAAPPQLESAITRAMSLATADRYQSCGAMVDGLQSATPLDVPLSRRPRTARLRAATAGVLLLAASAAAILVTRNGHGALGIDATQLDTLRFAVINVNLMDGSADSRELGTRVAEGVDGTHLTATSVEHLFHESLHRWRDLHVVDAFHVRDAAGRARIDGGIDLRRVASLVGAGRYVLLATTLVGDTLHVRALLRDTPTDADIAQASVRISRAGDGAGAQLDSLADALLFGEGQRSQVAVATATRSWAARRAYIQAQEALEQWNLSRADSALSIALDRDPDFAEGALWLALVRLWNGDQLARWAASAEDAARGSSALSVRDSSMAMAVLSIASGDRVAACTRWRALTRADPFDFAGWYGLGHCLRTDRTVIPDSTSVSGWRFRSSYAELLDAYEHAYRLLPSIHRSAGGGTLSDVQELFMVSGDFVRRGTASPPDTTRFLASPSWRDDSVAFVPFPARDFYAAREWTSGADAEAALVHLRDRYLTVASMFRAEFPQSVEAAEAVAAALDFMGNPSALDTLRAARRLASIDDDHIRTGAAEVWLLLKAAVPHDTARVRAARSLADSLLLNYVPSGEREAALMAGIAALTGRTGLAIRYARQSERRSAPAPIAESAPALRVFSALGGPVDSIHQLELTVQRAISSRLLGAEQHAARARWIVQAASLAFPLHQFEAIGENEDAGSTRMRLLGAVIGGNADSALQLLDDIDHQRRLARVRVVDVSSDGLLAEASALVALRRHRAAAAWIDPALDSLTHSAIFANAPAFRAASLVRLMALRADIALVTGDSAAARRWAAPVAVLWSDADGAPLTTWKRMNELIAAGKQSPAGM